MTVSFQFIAFLFLLFVSANTVTCHRKVSPCPLVFTYDDSKDTDDTWYGTIKLETNVDLHGITVDVIFDKAVSTFGAYYFNDVTTYDYLEYRVQNKNFKLEQGRTLVMNIYVRYAHQFPHVTQIRFNGQNVCPLRFSRFIRQATCKQVRESPPDGNSPTLSEKNLHKRN